MGRNPLGGKGEKTVMVPMRWPPALLARVDQARGDQDRSGWLREAVETKLNEGSSTPEVGNPVGIIEKP